MSQPVIHVPTRLGPLAVEETGQGEAILLWHSLFAERSMWRHQVAALADGYRLLLVDGPGHGESPPAPRPFRLDDCTEAAVEILDHLGIGRAVWVGLSWGGMVSMRAALHHPQRVRALALLDTSAEPEPLVNRVRNQLLTSFYRHFGYRDFLGEQIRPLMVGATTLREQPEIADAIMEHLASRDRTGMLRAIEAVVIERQSVLDRLREVSVPALVVVGEEDRATPQPFARRLAAALPHARLETVPGAGHLSALEAPRKVNQLLLDFLEGLPESAPEAADVPGRVAG